MPAHRWVCLRCDRSLVLSAVEVAKFLENHPNVDQSEPVRFELERCPACDESGDPVQPSEVHIYGKAVAPQAYH